jgi:hypothetical protein
MEIIMQRGKETFNERLQRVFGTYDFEAIIKLKEDAPKEYQEKVDSLLLELVELKKKDDRLRNMV